MSILLKQLFGLVKLLNSDKGTNQIAAGVACGLVLGLTPALSLQSFLVFVALFFFRIQIGAASWPRSSLHSRPISPTLVPPGGNGGFGAAGASAGFHGALQSAHRSFTRFYNTIVMGSGVVALACAPLVFVLTRWLVSKYRERIVARFEKSRFWHVFKATTFYQWYVKYDQLFG